MTFTSLALFIFSLSVVRIHLSIPKCLCSQITNYKNKKQKKHSSCKKTQCLLKCLWVDLELRGWIIWFKAGMTHMSPLTFKVTLSQFTCNQKPFDWQQWKLLINGLHQGLWHSRADTYIKMPYLSPSERCYTPLTAVMNYSNVRLRIQSYWKASHSPNFQRPTSLMLSNIYTDYSDVQYCI